MHTVYLYKNILLLFSLIIFATSSYASEILKRLDNPLMFPNKSILDQNENNIIFEFNKNFQKDGYVINFWATWCVPCKKELPDLSLLNSKIAKHDFEVLTVSIDQKNVKDQIEFLSKNGASELKHFFDRKMDLYKSLKLRGIPTTILVNRSGQIISIQEGIIKWGDDKVISKIKKLFY